MPEPSPAAVPAALHWRVLAALYDLFPALALWFVTAALVLLLRGGAPVAPDSAAAWLLLGSMSAVGFVYYGISWRRGGQTLGMRAWRLRLVGASGEAPPWSALLLRYLVAGLSLAAFGLGFLWSLWDPQRRSWHDLASDTRLLRLPRDAA